MTNDDLKKSLDALIEQRKRMSAEGADELEIQLVREKIRAVRHALGRRAPPTPREPTARKMTATAFGRGESFAQYSKWLGRCWGDVEEDGVTWADVERSNQHLVDSVDAVVQSLPDKSGDYFRAMLRGHSAAEIARARGVSTSSVSRPAADAKRRMRALAEAIETAQREGDAVLDMTRPAAQKVLFSYCSAKQVILLYLWFGEWLSADVICDLLGVTRSTISRGLNRALRNLAVPYPGRRIVLRNLEALGAAAQRAKAGGDNSDLLPLLGNAVAAPPDTPLPALLVTTRGWERADGINRYGTERCSLSSPVMQSFCREADVYAALTSAFSGLRNEFRAWDDKPRTPRQTQLLSAKRSGKTLQQIADEFGCTKSVAYRQIKTAEKRRSTAMQLYDNDGKPMEMLENQMQIIKKEPNATGGRPGLQTWPCAQPPEGYVFVPEGFDTQIFHNFSGFVNIEHDGTYLTAMTGNQEALSAYLAEYPDVELPDPTQAQKDTDALVVDHELRLTLLELGLEE